MKFEDSIYEAKWHSLSEEETLNRLNTSLEGISEKEAKERIDKNGANKLPEGKKTTLFQIILHQVLNPLIFILVAAAVASIFIGEAKDAVFIFLVIFINSALGTYQEYNAEKSASALQRLMKIKAKVKRSGREQIIPMEDIALGDVVLIESGMKVPSDIRLFSANNLEIDESFLTGESIASKKEVTTLMGETSVAERKNMAFAGSTVLKGRGVGVTIATGIHTQVGVISQNVTSSDAAKPPLVLRMEKFIKQISLFIIVLSFLLALVLKLQGMDYTSIFFFVVALSVSAIPEGLPVALTVALSIATKRMTKRNVIVRKLTAVESLGSCTVIASDKTGTLTVNEQTAKKIITPNGDEFDLSGEGYNGEGFISKINNNVQSDLISELSELANISILANEGELDKNNEEWKFIGDSMDVALLGMSYKMNFQPKAIREQNPIIGAIPYESERQFAGSFYKKNEVVKIAIKGALEKILDFCDTMSIDGKLVPIDRNQIMNDASKLTKNGYRVLAFASGDFPNFTVGKEYENEEIPKLTFFGIVGFIDPLRKEAIKSVEECHDAGINVIMITGDHPETASAIARQLGIADENSPVVTGQMLSSAGDSESEAFEKLVFSTNVFGRVSPVQKLEIVDVLIRKGEFVAVTGDGVNDAPALKRANIGVAMGSGTDVAKEVGAMIVVDDNFSSIVAGVEEGRFAYDNVRKVIYLLISTGTAEIILFLWSIIAGLPLPLLAVQLLWLNLVTNGIQDVALAFEGGEPGAMKRKPRSPSEKIFNPLMIKQTLVSGFTMGAIAFGIWFWLNNFTEATEFEARNYVLLSIVLMQNFHAFNCRSERTSVFKIPFRKNIILVWGVIAAQLLHIVSMHIPFMQRVLRIEPVNFFNWLNILLLSLSLIVVMEIFKYFNKEKQNS